MPTKKYLHNIDLAQNELISAVLQNSATDPLNPIDGQIYYNTTSKTVKYYNGNSSSWSGIEIAGNAANIYNSDGTLTANRIITSDEKRIIIKGRNNETAYGFNYLGTRPYNQYPVKFAIELEHTFTSAIPIPTTFTLSTSGYSTGANGFIWQTENYAQWAGAAGYSGGITGHYLNVSRGSALDVTTTTNNSLSGFTSVVGHSFLSTQNSTTTDITSGSVASYSSYLNNYVGNITNAYHFFIRSQISNSLVANNTRNSTVTNLYNFYIENNIGGNYATAAVTNMYVMYIGTNLGATGSIANRWGIYALDSAMRHYFNGNVLLGSTSDSALAKLQVTGAIQQSSVTSGILKANVNGVLVAAVAGTDYLTTETDPVYVASTWYTTTNNSGNWDDAYSWGDHAAAGYLPVANPAYTGILKTGTVTYTPSGALAELQTDTVGYNQFVMQNSDNGSYSSSDFVVSNDLSTDSTYYGDFGINSSQFSGDGSFALPNAVYLYAANGPLVLGSITSNDVHIVTNSSDTDAVTLLTTGQMVLPHYTTSTSFTGTAVGLLAFTASGNIITVPSVAGGTVTSVDLSVPTGLSVSGNPITTSGTLALSYAAGYSIPTTASQTNWDSAYTATTNATSSNTINTIVKRDATGNFAAGKVTATSVQADYIDYVPKTNLQRPSYLKGRVYYNSEASSLIMYSDNPDVELLIGERMWIRCRNTTGAPIPKGAPVYVAAGVHIPGNPVHGHHMDVAMADASNINKVDVVGITAETIADGAHGYVVSKGYLTGINTSALMPGDRFHLGFSQPGTLVADAPEYPNFPVDLGVCLTGSDISPRNISSITLSNPVVITTTGNHEFEDFLQVSFAGIVGTTQLNGNTYYVDTINSTQFQLYSDVNLSVPVDGSAFTSYISGGTVTPTSHYGAVYVDIQQHTVEKLRIIGSSYVDGNLTVGGDLTIIGNSSNISVSSLNVADNWVYVGAGDTVTATFTGSGLNDMSFKGHYTGTINRTFYVKISSTGAADTFSWSYDDFATTEGSNITITGGEQLLAFGISVKFEAITGHTLNNKWTGTGTVKNVDFGFYGNYSTPSYTHAGFFRDATDGEFKFFSSYSPEITANIDTLDPSFTLGTVRANTFIGNLTGNASSVTDGVYTSLTYSNPAWITSLDWSKITNAPSFGYSVSSVTTTHTETATSGTKIIKANTTSGAFTITLPTAVNNTATIIIKKTAGSADLTVDGNGTETIDGGLTAIIRRVNESITLISDNSNWLII